MDSGFCEHLNNVSVVVGETAVLSCRVEGEARVVWKGPGGGLVTPSKRLALARGEAGSATLTITDCTEEDAGEYYCLLAGEESSVSTSCRLSVTKEPGAPGQPRVQDLRVEQPENLKLGENPGSGWQAVVTWDPGETPEGRTFTLQYCSWGEGREWSTVKSGLSDGLCLVHHLAPGQVYSFRVFSTGMTGPVSAFSLSSPPLTIPLPDLPADLPAGLHNSNLSNSSASLTSTQLPDPAWQPDFELQYIELEEVGRGRFSVVRRCQEILTGREVAVKFVNRRKQIREATKREYEVLHRLAHPGLVNASGLFTTVNSDAIVMDLVFGPTLLDWLCSSPSYTESVVHGYVTQLLSALAFLHAASIIHLDLRPEHCLLEADTSTLRLVDFGDAQIVKKGVEGMNMSTQSHPGPDFLPPEALSSGPVGPYSDMWAAGAILFLLLSGQPPFNEETDEETAAAILRCHLPFPKETWAKVSHHGRELVTRLLVVNPSQRVSATSCLSSPWALHANHCHTQLSSRLLSASALRLRDRVSRAENGFSASSTSSTRAPLNLVTPSSPSPRNALHMAPKASNSHNKLMSQMGHLLASEERNQRQSTTSGHHPDGVQRP